ncbi:ABC transporter ATP-binding protein [Pseudoroseomonas globiformis]|uniref:ABC transporter ATP-binding protein n=1 Tax=Teichococcus globiformis TaxID=2307229 RepID=A0ABV7FZ20_9PROT
MSTATGHALALHGVGKRYGGFTAVEGVDLAVGRGEFLTLLGPSGSGKTTLLMIIAGFVDPSAGHVLLDGNDITALPPEKRQFGMVFQGYALFPHMTVAENVAFPLRVRRMARADQAEKVRAALDLVQLSAFADRRPAQLSGGQQQRVALARALVFDPLLLLLDEPLSALDKKLRAELQEELKALHRRIGRTFVNVTHDQEEALSLSDRIAILNKGQVVQQGTPFELYEAPRTRFVADFLGTSNFLRGQAGPGGIVKVGDLALRVACPITAGRDVLLSLRPQKILLLSPDGAADNTVSGEVVSWSYAGAAFSLIVATEDLGPLRVVMPAWNASVAPSEGLVVRLGWSAEAAVVVEDDQLQPA